MTHGVLKRPRWRAPGATAFILLLALSVRAGADQPNAALRAVVQELVAEAVEIVSDSGIPKGEPDYASRCSHDVTPEEIGNAITQRLHRKPFVDAYVRWQLTSFDAPLPEMEERAFLKFMSEAPPMLENPRAVDATVQLFERVDDAGPLKTRDLVQVRERYDQIEKQAMLAELRNRPAVEFRERIAAKLGETGVNARLWLLEECAATINAGWPTRSVKTRISRSFLAASNETNFPREHQQLLAAQTKKLANMERRFVSEMTVYADGRVNVSFSTAGASEKDVEKWINRLAGVP